VQAGGLADTARVLIISNGHGEDLNGSLIAAALRTLEPRTTVAALPIVGSGSPYQSRGIPLLHRGRPLPSGGMVYQGFNLWRDLAAGLVQQTLAQLVTAWRRGRHCQLVLSVGDHVPLAFALLTGRPTVVFLVSTSSHYEGRLRLSPFTRWFCGLRRTRAVLTRDAASARELQAGGLAKARFLGYPIMDVLQPGDPLPPPLAPAATILALLPGSRLPEAIDNLVLMLRLCEQLLQCDPGRCWRFLAAVVPGTGGEALARAVEPIGWRLEQGLLVSGDGRCQVELRSDAFAAILHASQLVLGMAGTAVEQAVGLARPVVQLVGRGPQFSYAFAEAQSRLLGPTVWTVGSRPAGPAELAAAAALVLELLADPALPGRCRQAALERVGPAGGSLRIAAALGAELPPDDA
jgi:uncharacterized protein (TIGR03492 family)